MILKTPDILYIKLVRISHGGRRILGGFWKPSDMVLVDSGLIDMLIDKSLADRPSSAGSRLSRIYVGKGTIWARFGQGLGIIWGISQEHFLPRSLVREGPDAGMGSTLHYFIDHPSVEILESPRLYWMLETLMHDRKVLGTSRFNERLGHAQPSMSYSRPGTVY